MLDLSRTDTSRKTVADNIYTLQLLMEVNKTEESPLKGSLSSLLKCLC